MAALTQVRVLLSTAGELIAADLRRNVDPAPEARRGPRRPLHPEERRGGGLLLRPRLREAEADGARRPGLGQPLLHPLQAGILHVQWQTRANTVRRPNIF